MPIDTTKFVSAAILQQYLADKDGTPMANGTVTLYHDNARTILKNWYYQTGTPGNYTYIALPNPLTLSAAGTISDQNGVDTLPFYYPWSETDESVRDAYYIVIQNAAQTNQITRANFPYGFAGGGNITTIDTFNNLIVNNGFWRNLQPNTLNVTPFTSITLQSVVTATGTGTFSAIVAPSQHDGFRMPDLQFVMAANAGTDMLTFTPFPLASTQPILNTISPEFYINHTCSGAGSGTKYYQFPISLHVNTLEGVTFTGSIQAQNVTGSGLLSISILQDTGTGGGTSTPQLIMNFNLSNSWTTYTFGGTFPSTTGLVLGAGADDGLYLLIGLDGASGSFSLNFTAPTVYLTDNILPTNDFQTYDQVDTVINSVRTGDLRTSMNNFYPYGWVAMNGGTLSNVASTFTNIARANADAWQLYNLLWNKFSPYANGTSNPLGQLITAPNTAVAYGASAYADFIASKALVLTQIMGKVLMGTVPVSAMLIANSTTFTASSSTGLLITTANTVNYFNGMPIVFSNTGGALPTGLSNNIVYYVGAFNGTNAFKVATSFANAIAQTFIAFTNAGSGTNTVTGSLAGSFTGESQHTLTSAELPSPLTSNTDHFVMANGTGAAIDVVVSANTPNSGIVANGGGGQAHNIIQPSAFTNIYIKL